MLDIEKLYLKSPIILQNILLNIKSNLIYRRRYGNNFKLFLNNYLKSDKQLDKILLREFLSSASHTKFWAKKFKKHNFNINAKDIQQEIKKLPILNKKEVKQNIDEIINIENSKSYSWANTSGTTGSGLVFPQTRVMEQKQWAIWWRHRITHGIKFGTWMGWFGGRSIASLKQKKPPFHRLNYPMKQIMFSAYHLNIDTVIIYYDLIKKFKLKWLHGYPSQISNFASLVNQIGLPKIETLEIISFGAETLLESQKENIKKVHNVQSI